MVFKTSSKFNVCAPSSYVEIFTCTHNIYDMEIFMVLKFNINWCYPSEQPRSLVSVVLYTYLCKCQPQTYFTDIIEPSVQPRSLVSVILYTYQFFFV